MKTLLYAAAGIALIATSTLACLPSDDFNSTPICELQSENVDGREASEQGFTPSNIIDDLLLEGTSSLAWKDGEVTELHWNIDSEDGEYFLVTEIDSYSGEPSSVCDDQYMEVHLTGQFSTTDGGLDDLWPIKLLVRDVDDIELVGKYAVEELEGDLPNRVDGNSDNSAIRLQGDLAEAEFNGALFLDSYYSDEFSSTDGAWVRLAEWPIN